MKIVIAGGNGFLGKGLEKYFVKKGNEVFILTRNPMNSNDVHWDAKTLGNWVNVIEGSDVLINLVGKSVDCRYNDKNRDEILSSRIGSTNILQEAVDSCVRPPKLWMNASSATIYTHAETLDMTEDTGIIGDDFSMGICKQWEKAFFAKHNQDIRKIALRTSIVLGEGGGAWPKLKLVSQLGLGGKQGRGNQYVSYIHIDDFCRSIKFLIDHKEVEGAINITSPLPIRNSEFMKEVAKVTKPLFALPSPTCLLEIASIFLGTETELLLKSRKVVPQKLLNLGFKFEKGLKDL